MRWTLRGTAIFAALTTGLYAWACAPDQPSPVDPLGTPPVALAPSSYTPVAGAAFTTYNPWVDGEFKEICKNSIINCNIYGAKEDVWLNGGPAANGLTDGEYFFVVLVPGGQPNPNDLAPKNLSDDYDAYTNRTFTVSGGEVSFYGGTHDSDDGPFEDENRRFCKSPRGCDPVDEALDGPLVRLFPYDDTTNPGGVYILAICSLDGADPANTGGLEPGVKPRDCKYDAFKVKEGKVTYEFMLSGVKFEDLDADGSARESGEPGLPGWTITIKGTGFAGEAIDATVTTGAGGAWMYSSEQYSFGPRDAVQNAELTVCEVLQNGWYQSFPSSTCYDVTIEPAGVAYVQALDFGNYQPVDITAKKFYDRDLDEEKDAGEEWIANFQFCLYVGGDASTTKVAAGDFVPGATPDAACQTTDANGSVTWDNLKPGTYTVKEEDADYWIPTTDTYFTFLMLYSGDSGSAEFGNVAICIGLTPGYWSNWENHYTPEQFARLLDGTIADVGTDADNIAEAEYVLSSIGCDGGDAVHCLRRFQLSNQLTLNLTQTSGVFNDGVELYPACQLPDDKGVDGNLGY
ncbi:MAG: hypothetical protein JSU98_17180, partial [Gemmatimonadales bacterium]